MKIINVHERVYHHTVEVLGQMLTSLSSDNDRLWPSENWPPMILSNGLKPDSEGGHGPIGYYVSKYEKNSLVEFTFTRPKEFLGVHRFEIIRIADNSAKLSHTIEMDLNLKGALIWYLAVKWLHDALLEDCLDKVHNQLSAEKRQTPHNIWVRILREVLRKRDERQ